MKKSLIAAAGTTLAVAALPAVGVFASGSFTDTVQVNVSKSCIFKAEWTDGSTSGSTSDLTNGRTFSKNDVAPGTLLHFGGSNSDGAEGGSSTSPTIKMECNDGNGQASGQGSGTWTVTAVGGNEGANINKMTPAVTTNTPIATGTLESGATSNWAFKIVASGGTVSGNYGGWSEVPSTATTVLTGVANASAADITFSPEYQVYVGTAEVSDTFTGKVVYSLSSTFAD